MTERKTFWEGSRWWLPFLFLMLSLAAIRPLAAEDVAPMAPKLTQDDQGRVVVDVRVRGEGPYPFLLDTAASRTVMYRTLVSLLELDAVPFKSRRVMTATGAREMQLYRIGEIEAFGKTLDVGQTVAMPDPAGSELFGILGIDLLRGHQLYLDRQGVRLEDEADFRHDPAWLDLRARAVGYGSLAVTVLVEGVEIHALVDTGSGATVLNGPAFEALQKVFPDSVTDDQVSVSAGGGAMRAQVMRVPMLSIGPWQLTDQRLLSAHLPVFATFGASRAPAMILGMDVLLEAEGVAMDFRHWRLHVKPR